MVLMWLLHYEQLPKPEEIPASLFSHERPLIGRSVIKSVDPERIPNPTVEHRLIAFVLSNPS
jgi:hypothetical protein